MASFLVDEDLPRWLADDLTKDGHQAIDVRDAGLRGQPDEGVQAFAIRAGMTLLTGDVEFGGLAKHAAPPAGKLLVRMPDSVSAKVRVDLIVAILRNVTREELAGHVGVI